MPSILHHPDGDPRASRHAWRDGEWVGTLTLFSDGVNYATIDDVVVNRGHTGMYWRRSATDGPPAPEANSLSST
jgi:hypothetical protein